MSELSSANILNLVTVLIFVYSLLLGVARSRNMILGFFGMALIVSFFAERINQILNSIFGNLNPLATALLITVWGILNGSLIATKHSNSKKFSLVNIISAIFVSGSLMTALLISSPVGNIEGINSSKYWQFINNNIWNVSLACILWLTITLIFFKGHDKK